jgi:hypothetical protein
MSPKRIKSTKRYRVRIPDDLQMKLVRHGPGRAVLHVVCFMNGKPWKLCWLGIKRDLFS